MTGPEAKAVEHAAPERVCPWCQSKHWEHGTLCARCEGAFQLEQFRQRSAP